MFSRLLLQILSLCSLFCPGAVASNLTEGCEDKDSTSWLQSGRHKSRDGRACDCEYTIKKGDSCWILSHDYFGVKMDAILDTRNKQTCPEAELWVGDLMCIKGPTKGLEKCGSSPSPPPPPPPSPGRCELPPGFQTELYWMPYTDKDLVPSAQILRRITKLIMAFVGTYKYTKESHYQRYMCENTCTFPNVWPVTTKGSEWAKQMKSVNPDLKVTISFGGWNEGPGDEAKNCYQESGCYDDIPALADELAALASLDGIDGIDLDYEMSPDLEPGKKGVPFLGQLSLALRERGVEVSQAPQPPYFDTTGPGAGSYTQLLQRYPESKRDHMAIQFYNNDDYMIGEDDDAISHLYWSAVDKMGGDGQKVLLGLCFVDCNPGYSAYYPDSPSKNERLAPDLLQKAMQERDGFGGIMIWANPKSQKAGGHCDDGCFSRMPSWLDTVCFAVGGTPAPSPPPPPVPEDDYNGQFLIPDWGQEWNYVGPAGPMGICFGGASDIAANEWEGCNPGGSLYQKTAQYSTSEKYYSFGGGDAQDNQWWTETKLDELNAYMQQLVGSYEGIFYDIETFPKNFDVSSMAAAFAQSFATARAMGLNIIASTSYTAPYFPENKGYPSDYQGRVDELWTLIMANEDVQIFSPQFYGNGKTASISQTFGSSVGFSSWTSTISQPSGKIRPILKAKNDVYFKNQINAMEAKCPSIGAAFCEGGYILWGST
mmetsp:Transcript_6321/g.14560  ORF Transcript_6321/g.14560 Transcript_6321/m.14560 type:complete len:711 (-) Transcript_6321:260-2392(-)